jgi:YVTN family beta-propeller protein
MPQQFHYADGVAMIARIARWAALAVIALGSIGCPSDNLINTASQQWQLLAAISNGGETRLALYQMPDGVAVETDVYRAANGAPLEGRVVAIEQFRSMLFLLQPEQQRIEVLDASTFARIAQISTAPHAPLGMCFANGTTAYTANGDSTVSVVDLTTYAVVRTLTVGTRPVAIAALGNQVAVCNQHDGSVSIIDTRTNAVTRTVPVAPYPTYVAAGGQAAESFCIISLGSGKLAQGEQTSPAMAQFYNPFTGELRNQVELSQYDRDAASTVPRGIVAATTVSSGIVLLDEEVQFADLAGERLLGTALVGSFSGGTYNFARDLLVVWGASDGGTTVVALDPRSGAERSRVTLPVAISSAAGR